MVGRAVVLGILSGGCLGMLVVLVLAAPDAGEYGAVNLAAVAAIYLPFGFGVGALTGAIEALLAASSVLLLGSVVRGRVLRARVVAASAAAMPGLVALPLGAPVVFAVPFAAVAGGAAAFWVPRVLGAQR